MRIAVPYENGMVVPAFEQATTFKLYDTKEDQIVKELILPAGGSGADLLIDFLAAANVRMLLCGAVAGSTIALLDKKGILFQWGVLGKADEKVDEFLKNQLAAKRFSSCKSQGGCCGDGDFECSCGDGCSGCEEEY
ncbi:NifB/NifX family molybdenum-iron cluster-binding protein [Hominifimenecus sp. rT4P-3]|uniref:NifB/NifX family molybdenum-iron cluster-binding protein n=1 Tax=Hominifimenecus sp. rT4P-3 TaxID=3242979 RepID=UPI003DA58708